MVAALCLQMNTDELKGKSTQLGPECVDETVAQLFEVFGVELDSTSLTAESLSLQIQVRVLVAGLLSQHDLVFREWQLQEALRQQERIQRARESWHRRAKLANLLLDEERAAKEATGRSLAACQEQLAALQREACGVAQSEAAQAAPEVHSEEPEQTPNRPEPETPDTREQEAGIQEAGNRCSGDDPEDVTVSAEGPGASSARSCAEAASPGSLDLEALESLELEAQAEGRTGETSQEQILEAHVPYAEIGGGEVDQSAAAPGRLAERLQLFGNSFRASQGDEPTPRFAGVLARFVGNALGRQQDAVPPMSHDSGMW
mmetsp:Transcript_42102/g.68216  ORF Transcript_42102/g.68216 Transcript_42102/m.68216 type:complete len:317 (-) Transcript_42102:72-1022(-)